MAGNLIELRRRIRSVRNTQKLTKAMKTVSAAKLRRASGDLRRSRPYAAKVGDLLAALAPRLTTVHPLLAERSDGVCLVVAVSADKGLCGVFNSRLLKRVDERLQELRAAGREVRLVTVGSKAVRYFAKRETPVERSYPAFMGRLTFENARQLADDLVAIYDKGGVRSVEFVYTEFLSASRQSVGLRQLLPVAPGSNRPAGPETMDILEPSADRMFAELLPLWLRSQVYGMLLHSSASEHVTRMVAMDLATRNASDMIRSLTLTMNKLRQASITNELLEIITATEALKK
jgi:F-type H+-transporting ATPase subunit gamma